jgi:Leucine-rich repeat (LRR) protein
MDNNKIKEIPNEISNLKSLSKMYFRNNLIKVVPASLQKIATLKYFYINGCPIDTLEAP